MFSRVFVSALIAVVVTGCGSSSGGTSSEVIVVAPQAAVGGCPLIAGTGTSDLSGIYDITNYGRSPANVIYTYIDRDGMATDFDFDNDSFGNGLNCYVKGQEGFASFTRVTGDRYVWTFGNPFDDSGCAYAQTEVVINQTVDALQISSGSSVNINWRRVDEARLSDLTVCP